MASLPRLYRYRLIARWHAADMVTPRRSRLHVDNPVDRVKFGQLFRKIRERFMRGVGVRKEVKTG
jgi:hypothetical protein